MARVNLREDRMDALTFPGYVDSVITPILAARVDDGDLAVWLNRQIDEWEMETERPDGLPFADQVVAKLNELLADLRQRIKDRITVLGQILDAVA
jgi:hypothetical protein